VPYREEGAKPSTTCTIDGDQRDGLHELLRNHLGAVGDLWIALEINKDFATAERLGLEFGEDFRLLEDIGWNGRDGRKAFELTMPPEDLMELLQRLHGEAERVLLESVTERESREERRRDQRTISARLQRLPGTAGRPRPTGGGLTIRREPVPLLGGRGAGHREAAELLLRGGFCTLPRPPRAASQKSSNSVLWQLFSQGTVQLLRYALAGGSTAPRCSDLTVTRFPGMAEPVAT
jgi:hypothetical protein